MTSIYRRMSRTVLVALAQLGPLALILYGHGIWAHHLGTLIGGLVGIQIAWLAVVELASRAVPEPSFHRRESSPPGAR